MSGAAAGGAAAAAAAAAEHRRRMQEEEERMTGYNTNEMDGWEFKILRANVRKFKDPQVIRQVCDEEAKAGWEMVEKFDDYRIRFKRRIDKRANDQYLNIDPYRTHLGMTEGTIAAVVLGILAAAGGIAALIFFAVNR